MPFTRFSNGYPSALAWLLLAWGTVGAASDGAQFIRVDTNDRDTTAQFYYDHHVSNQSVPIDWTGNTATCTAGTTSQAYIDATIALINYYRAMTGLPAVVNHVADNQATQEAALMFRANAAVSHSPPASWACYTHAGAQAAGSSNIALMHGTMAVAAYVRSASVPSAGYRRWILYPPRTAMGTGSTPNSNAIHIFGPQGSRPASPVAVAWPPSGYLPYQLAPLNWSFSLNSDPGADYTNAQVSMSQGGVPVALSIVSTIDPFADNTIVWQPQLPTLSDGMVDIPFDVTISNIASSSVTEWIYQVTIFDPATADTAIFADAFQIQ